jgi:hypothetical protein
MAKKSGPRPRRARSRDIALIVDRTEDQEGFQVLRRRGDDRPVELGAIRPLKEGKPIDGEVVSLRPRKDVPFAFDVKTELEVPAAEPPARATSDGPAQVANRAYRDGWDAIWGKRRPPSARLN